MRSKIILRSFKKRISKVILAVIAVTMASAIISALVTISLKIKEKVAYEMRSFGPNLLLAPKTDTIEISIGAIDFGTISEPVYIEERDLPKLWEIKWYKNILGAAPYLFAVVDLIRLGESTPQKVVLAGTWFDQLKAINKWWSIDGKWINTRNSTDLCIIGKNVANKLGLRVGSYILLNYTYKGNSTGNPTIISKSIKLKVAGIADTGSEDDNRIFTNLDVVQNLTGKHNKVNIVQVSALCNLCPVEAMALEFEKKLPYIEAKPVKQITEAEMNLLAKTEKMMLFIAIVVLIASAFGMMSTMTTSVIERTKEIGLMKAIGAKDKEIAFLFLAESIIAAIIGGIIGFFVGLIIAQILGISVFGTSISPKIIVFPIAITVAIFVAVISSIMPIRRAISVEPAEVLKGE
jgi:putative ABC transport system permease protein